MNVITIPHAGDIRPPKRARPTLADVGLLEHTPLPSVVLVPDGWILWHNEAALELLDDRVGSALLGHPLSAIVDIDPRRAEQWAQIEQPTRALAHLRSGQHDQVELRAARLANGSVVVQITPTAAPAHASGLEPPSETRTADAFRRALLDLSALAREVANDSHFFRSLLQRMIEVIPGAQAGSILLRSGVSDAGEIPGAQDDAFEFVAAEGYDLRALQRYPLTTAELFRDAEHPAATISHDLDNTGIAPEKRDWLRQVGRTDEIQSSVSAPVVVDGSAVAFISLNNFDDRDAFDEPSAEMTTLLGRLMADLIWKRWLEAALRRERESFRHLAHQDPLTGLANRRHIETVIADAIAAADGHSVPMALLALDLDDFKAINDSYGYEIGDEVLVEVAERLRDATRRSDVLGRWGGDEFVLLALDCDDAASAAELGDRLIAALNTPIVLSNGRSIECGVSVGATWTSDGRCGIDALLSDADHALYDAKLVGKGTVRVHAA